MWNSIKSFFQPNTPPSPPANDERLEDIEFVQNYTRQEIRGGYEDRDETIALIQGWIDDDGLTFISASELVDDAINALLEEQKTWPEITDYDRLHQAMLDLEEIGILAREHYTCCGTCGMAEIHDEMQSYRDAGKMPRGYTFFHQQSTEGATEGENIYLWYGSSSNSTEDCVSIGHEVAETFRTHGFEIDWNGTIEKSIGIIIDWKRRWEHAKP